eukprot:m.316251 g.316251  ORF g.316251 m.316251 type:complete len:330 (-) comp23073_c1_seq9:290-1279(-)
MSSLRNRQSLTRSLLVEQDGTDGNDGEPEEDAGYLELGPLQAESKPDFEQLPSDNHQEGHRQHDHHHHEPTPQEKELQSLLCRQHRFLRALGFLLLFSYETLTEQALQLVNCIHVGACGRVLGEYPDVPCRGNRAYDPLLAVAVVLLVYAALFPTGLFWFLRKYCIRQPREMQAVLEAKYGVFYDHFKPQCWWWEVQVIARRLLLLVVYVANYTHLQQRTYGVAVMCVFIGLFHAYMRPFKHAQDNTLELLSLTMLSYAAITKSSFVEGSSSETDGMHIVIATVLAVMAVTAAMEALQRYSHLLPHGAGERVRGWYARFAFWAAADHHQ